MRITPKFVARRLTRTQRRVYVAATLYFFAAFAAMIWPLYPLVSHVRPLVLGMPFGLFFLAALLVVSFLVALALYLWEERSGLIDAPVDAGDGR